MSIYKLFDKNTGIYRSKDSIENFKFRITLKSINTLIQIPKLLNSPSSVDLPAADGQSKDNIVVTQENVDDEKCNVLLMNEKNHTETIDLKWQEKLLNLNEIKQYHNEDNCKTDLQKKYHQMIINNYGLDSIMMMMDEGKLSRKIFTYINDDNNANENLSNDLKSKPNNLEENIKLYGMDDGDYNIRNNDGNSLLLKNSFDDDDTIQSNKKHFKNLNNFEIMFICASLEIETLLFTIRWRASDGLLVIYPDFNDIHINPYFLEINLDSRHMYQYSIENLSLIQNYSIVDNNNDNLKLSLNISKNYISLLHQQQQKQQQEECDLKLFHLPPRRCINIYLFIEIVSAKNFQYDNIHVRYNIHIPSRCKIINNCKLNGSTHTSKKLILSMENDTENYCHSENDDDDHDDDVENTNYFKNCEIWKFGHCFELNILCDEDYKYDDYLKITFEVISIDGWERERTEGYTHLQIPFYLAGQINETLECYRELDGQHSSLINTLNRYFIGGRKQFNVNAFNGIQNSTQNQSVPLKINRYGTKTLSTGSLLIKRQMIIQKNPNFLHINNLLKNKNNLTSFTGDGGGGGDYDRTNQFENKQHQQQQLTIDDVISAYYLAKQRLEATT